MPSDEERRFRNYLEEAGLKLTTERRLILEQVFRTHRHFEAEDVVAGLRRMGRRVSRASVYRALPLLVQSGLLRDVYSAEKHSHYEHVFGHEHHDHLVCSQCGRTIEFSSEEIEDLQERVCTRHRFQPASHKLEITGLCEGCQGETVDHRP